MFDYAVVAVVGALMVADYFLTLLGARLAEGAYSRHFRISTYELNPLWQEAVRRRQWINPRHLLSTLATVALLLFLVWAPRRLGAFDLRDEPFLAGTTDILQVCVRIVLGALVAVFSVADAQHLANILTFRFLARNPGEVSGSVEMSHRFSLREFVHRSLATSLLVLVLVCLSPNLYLVGAFVGCLLLVLHGLRWTRNHENERARAQATAAAPPGTEPPSSPAR